MTSPLKRTDIKLRLKLKVGEDSIGPGKARLLEKIDETGSISAAAREMGLNYRRAWFLLETISKAIGQPAVLTSKGGRHGGGAVLTEAGAALLEAYRACTQTAGGATNAHLEDLYMSLNNSR